MSYKNSYTKYKHSRSTRDIIDNMKSNRSQIFNISKIDLITRNNSPNMRSGSSNSNQTTANKHCLYYNHIPKTNQSNMNKRTNMSFIACSLYKQHQHLHNIIGGSNNKLHSQLPIKLHLPKVKIHFLHSKDLSIYKKRLSEINSMSNSLIREKMYSYCKKKELNILPLLLPFKAVNNNTNN